eukprot:m.230472 g.230472  ORF g.230472 m.230472 type:complete len:61 (-) comp16000_c0_seq4:3169-3351(-)
MHIYFVGLPGLKKLITELPSEYPSSLESFVMALTVKGGFKVQNPKTGGFEQLVMNLRNFP